MSGYLSRLARRAAGAAPTPQAPRLPSWAPVVNQATGQLRAPARATVGPDALSWTPDPVIRPAGEPTARQPMSEPEMLPAARPLSERAGEVTPQPSQPTPDPPAQTVLPDPAAPVTIGPVPTSTVRPLPPPARVRNAEAGSTWPVAESPAAPTAAPPVRGHEPTPTVADPGPRSSPPVVPVPETRRDLAATPPSTRPRSEPPAVTRPSKQEGPPAGPVKAVPTPTPRASAQPVARVRTGQPERPAPPGNAVQVHIGTIEIQGAPVPATPEQALAAPVLQPAAPAGGAFDEFVGLRTYAPWRW